MTQLVKTLLLSVAIVFICCGESIAQLPSCDENIIHYITSFSTTGLDPRIYNYDPSQPIVTGLNPTLNSIVPPVASAGLTVSSNLGGAGPDATFYTVVGGQYYYYDGNSWINTGHNSGEAVTAVNPGAGGGFIYNYDGIEENITRYDGTSDATFLISTSGFNKVADISVDCEGNFYIFFNALPQELVKYNSSGEIIQTWTATGAPVGAGGGGLAVIGNDVYYHDTYSLVHGIINGSSVAFTVISEDPSFTPTDFATCSGSSGIVHASVDTGYYCGSGDGITVVAAGNPPFSWAVISGPGIISGSGDSVVITSAATTRVVLSSPSTCGVSTDTVTVIVPSALIDAGQAFTIEGCVSMTDTLNATAINLHSAVNYTYSWQPANSITAGINTLSPVINPVETTVYYLEVSTSGQGNCIWRDSIEVNIINTGPQVNFIASDTAGSAPLSVSFQNQSLNSESCEWFIDESPAVIQDNIPMNFNSPGDYTVTLICSNGSGCFDTLSMTIHADTSIAFQVPDCFTPNKDGFNDVFKVLGSGISEFRAYIYNRWGLQIYSWEGIDFSWNGEIKSSPAPEGVYFYVLNAKDNSGKIIEMAGTVTLLR